MPKRRHHYTIMIVPHNERETVTIRIPVFILQLLVILVVAGILVMIIWLNQYFQMQKNYERVKMARIEADTMKKEYTELIEKVLAMEDGMLKIQELEQKIRLENGFEPGDYEQKSEDLSTVQQLTIDRKSAVTASSLLMNETREEINQLESEIPNQIESLESLIVQLEEKQHIEAHTPDLWPTVGRLTSTFGYRKDPFTKRKRLHEGIDLANRINTPIYAAADGKVIFAARDAGYGRLIKINHQNGIVTYYGHLNKMSVHEGQEVKKGQLIGYMGSSGRSTGPHLHFEIHINGKPVNPLNYLSK